MNKKLLEMLERINAQKKTVQDLVDAGKLTEASEAKKELIDMQKAFDLLKDIEEETPAAGVKPKKTALDAVAAFAAAARRGFRNEELGYNSEGDGEEGGYTVPEDIQTRINRYREANFSLESLVSHENVTTNTGRRTYQKRGSYTGFSKVAEGGKIGKVAGPQFDVVTYKIDKFAGALPVTDELLADSDANVTNVITEWLGEESIATRNNLILALIEDESEEQAITGIDDIKKHINVTLGQKFAGRVSVVTNDDGLQYLDTLKDENGRYLLQNAVDPTKPEMTLTVGARKIPVVVVPNEVLKTTENKIPVIIGSLKDYCKIFDRQKTTIKASDIGVIGDLNAYEQDLTIFRAIERLDVELLDDDALVNGYIAVNGTGTETTEP